MRMSIRVARRHMMAKGSLPEDFSFKVAFLNKERLKVEIKWDGYLSVGSSTASFKKYTQDEIEYFFCYEEMGDLIEIMPKKLIGSDGKIRVVEVLSSHLMEHYRGRGFGLSMYEQIISSALSANGNAPFLFIPNYCNSTDPIPGKTTQEALRVWKSLAQKYPSSGDVILITGRGSR